MEIPGTGFLVARPCRLLHAGEHHSGVGIRRLLVGPDIPFAIGRILRASRVTKPRMLVRGVIDDEIDDDANPTLAAAMGELDEIAQRAVTRIDAVIVGDVVAVIPAWRGLKWHQPDRGNAKSVQIIEPAKQPPEIAEAVGVGIHISSDGETIENTILVPKVINHGEAALFASAFGCHLSSRCSHESSRKAVI